MNDESRQELADKIHELLGLLVWFIGGALFVAVLRGVIHAFN